MCPNPVAHLQHRAAYAADPVALCGKAHTLKEMGRLEEALTEYGRAANLFPWDSIPITGRAHVLRRMRRFDDARAILFEARARFPNDSDIYSELAELSRDKSAHQSCRGKRATLMQACVA